jgi:hypothetical protein
VKLYTSAGITNGSKYNLKIERGSGLPASITDRSCSGFSASSVAYDGSLGGLGTTYGGGVDGKASAAAWNLNDTQDYRFTITVIDDGVVNGHTTSNATGAHSFTWEAQNN